jgi:hypothetical protein
METLQETQEPNFREIDYAQIDFSRDENAHLIIKIKGRDCWKQFRHQDESLCTIAGVKCYRPKQDIMLNDIRGRFVIDSVHEYDEYPNLMLIMAKDIETGVTFDFGNVPMSESRCYSWADNLKYQLTTLYLAYVKPVNIKATFTTQIVEKKSFD